MSGRTVVLGGTGFFGAAAVELLRETSLDPLVGARGPGADVRVDVEDPASIRAALRPDDRVLDAVGPFQDRSTALVETAAEVGFDLVDIADDPRYVGRVLALRERLARSEARVLPACSTVSAITASLVRAAPVDAPRRVSVFLRTATGRLRGAGTLRSMLENLDRPATVLRDGETAGLPAWRSSRTCELPDGSIRGRLFPGPDPLTLPEVWPSLRTVDLWVDTQVPLLDAGLAVAARSAAVRRLARATLPLGAALARTLGPRRGGIAYEIEGREATWTWAIRSEVFAHRVAVLPAVLALEGLAAGRYEEEGLVRVDRQVEPDRLIRALRSRGVTVRRYRTAPPDRGRG